jgi:hypothetical protein
VKLLSAIFYKAKLLILIFSVVSMLFTLGGMAFVNNEGTYKPMPQLSDESLIGAIQPSATVNGKDVFLSIISEGDSKGIDFSLSTELVIIDAIALYYSSKNIFSINIVSGRIFSEDDFREHSNTVIVYQDIVNECEKRDDVLWWDYGGMKYEVIGVYQADDSYDNPPKCIINLTSNQLSPDVFREFIFDSGSDSEQLFKALVSSISDEYPELEIDYIPLANAANSEYVHYATNFGPMQLMLIILTLLILLNSISIFSNWIMWHQKELAIRKLCGSSNRQLFIWIMSKMFFFIAFSNLIGIVCAKLFLDVAKHLPVAHSAYLMFGSKVSLIGVMIGVGLLFLLSGALTSIVLKRYMNKAIVENIK